MPRNPGPLQKHLFRHFNLEASKMRPAELSQPTPLHSRHIKSRSGCEPCKRRHVKCDEAQPRCRRCEARNETCTGNFQADTWQVERPWLSIISRDAAGDVFPHAGITTTPSYFTLVPENDLLRHWFNHACLTMAILPPPQNPLSYGIAPYLHQSKALRHTIQCVSQAHQHFFSGAQLAEVLEERERALVSLQNEIDRVIQRNPLSQLPLLRTILLSSLLLGISSGWLIGDDYGFQYLEGTRQIISLILQYSAADDEILRYLLGLYVYWEVCSSYIESNAMTATAQGIVSQVAERHLTDCIHPVLGLATSLYPTITQVGQYYRKVVNLFPMGDDGTLEFILEAKLHTWIVPRALTPSNNDPTGESKRHRLLEMLAESQRAMGLIMLYQARSVAQGAHTSQFRVLRSAVETVMSMLKLIPPGDPLLNSEGPLLVIAGSELLESDTDYRALVERHVENVTRYTRVRAYMSGFQLVREIWKLRSAGSRIAWLELMLQKGKVLSLA